MTLASTASRIEYVGDGTTTAFSFPYKFLANADLKVYQEGTLKTLTTHYTVTGAGGGSGGTVTFLTAPADDDEIIIFRDPAITQSLDYVANDTFPAESHESALDRLTMIAQRAWSAISRSARLADSDTTTSTLTLTPEATTFLGWDSNGNLANFTATQIMTEVVYPDDYHTVHSVLTYGATGDGVTDDSAAIQDALDAVVADGGGALYFPGGDYLLSSQVVVAIASSDAGIPMVVFGDGSSISRILVDNADGGIKFDCAGVTDQLYLHNLAIEPAAADSGVGFWWDRPELGQVDAKYQVIVENVSFTPKQYYTSTDAFDVPLRIYGVYRPHFRGVNCQPGRLATTKATALLDISECWDPQVIGCRFTAGVRDTSRGKVTAAARAANVVTITTAAAHGYASNDSVIVRVRDDTTMSGTFTISVTSATTFTYSDTGDNASYTGGNIGNTSLGTGYWVGGADYGIYYYSTVRKPEGGRIRECNIVGCDTGVYVRKYGAQPQLIISDNHINAQYYNIRINGAKYGEISNNLFYNTLPNELDEEGGEDTVNPSTGTFYDIYLEYADGLEIKGNGFRGGSNLTRRHVWMTPRALGGGETSAPVVRNIVITNNRLNAQTTSAPYYAGSGVDSVHIRLPVYPADTDFADYPTMLVEQHASATNIFIEYPKQDFPAKAYGVTADGTTDDLAALTRAIVAANAAGGGVVKLPEGTIYLSTVVDLLDNVTIEGAGIGATTLQLANAASTNFVRLASGVDNVTIRDLTIDGAGSTSTGGSGIRIGGSQNVTIERVRIQDCASYGIGIQDGTNKTIKINEVIILDTGSDGIDIKNVNDDNEDIQISNVSIRNWCNEGRVLTAISQANPAVITYTGTDPANNDEVYLSEIGGMVEMNNITVRVTTVTGGSNTFEPASTTDTLTITGITQAAPAVLTYTGTDPSNGDLFWLHGIVGMTQLNSVKVKVSNVNAGANTFELETAAGVDIDSSAYTAYASAGTAYKLLNSTAYTAYTSGGKMTSEVSKAGIDCRGPVTITNVWVSDPGNDATTGIRFRNGELLNANGLGGHTSSLSNFQIRMGTAAASRGISVNARDVTIANGYINGGQRGINLLESGGRVTNVTVEDTSDSAYLLNTEDGTTGDNTLLMGCHAVNAGMYGFEIAESDNVRLLGCYANSCDTRGFSVGTSANSVLRDCYAISNAQGITVTAAASGTQIIGGRTASNAGTQLLDNGTATLIKDVSGYVTEAYILSGTFAIDSTGVKTVTTAHGLAAAPTIHKCTAMLTKNTAVNDFDLDWIRIESVDATNVVCEVKVETASGTGSATAKLGIYARI